MKNPNDRTVGVEFPATRDMLTDVELPKLFARVLETAIYHVQQATEGRSYTIRGLKLVTGQTNDDFLRGPDHITVRASIDIRLDD